ncbi:MAG: hypothetical protein PHD36_05385 [Desulfotomaculaceae bacterium]|nr:hypothetical protein [Desulfotomaculaceae bacterium]
MTFMPVSTESDTPAKKQCQPTDDTNVKINSIAVMVCQGESCILSNDFNQLDFHEEMEQASGKDFLQDKPASEPGSPEKEKDLASEDELFPEASVEVNNINVNVNRFMVHDRGSNSQVGCSSSKDSLQDKPTSEPGLPEKEKDLASEDEPLPEASVEVNLTNANLIQCPVRERQEIINGQDNCRREVQEEYASKQLNIPGKDKNVNLKQRQQASIKINHICAGVSQYPGRLYQEILTTPARCRKETCEQPRQVTMPLIDSATLEKANTDNEVFDEVGERKIMQPVFEQVPENENNTGGEDSNSAVLISRKDLNLPREVTNKQATNKEVASEEGTNEKVNEVTNEGVTSREVSDIEGAELLDMGSQDDSYLEESVIKQEEIIEQKTINVVSEQDSIEYTNDADKSLHPKNGQIIKGDYCRQKQRPQNIILALLLITGMFFLRFKI